MKRFSKILTLLLAIVAIVSVFTVVALAEDETTLVPLQIKSSTGKFSDGTFTAHDPKTTGTTIFQDSLYKSLPKTGIWNIHTADNGNVYLQSEYAEGGSGAHDNLDMYFNYAKETTVDNYPYIAFDMDVMTENGTYGKYPLVSVEFISNSKRVALGSTYFNSMKLDTTPYNWQHLTYIIEYQGNGIFQYHFYINGEFSVSSGKIDATTKATAEELGGSYDKLGLYFFRFYPSIHSTAKENGKLGYDNFNFTLFPKNYVTTDAEGNTDFSKIATYYYNGEYELPYGLTEATVGEDVYDDANKAVSAAEKGDTVKLTMNAKETLVINKNILLDTNVYDEQGNTTGTFYTFDYVSYAGLVSAETSEGSGIYSFERSPDAVDVIWDPKCEGECDCFAEFGGHAMHSKVVLLLGEVPTYPNAAPS